MDALEIAPGLWRWTGYHEEWKENVGCVYCETQDGVVLIDPLVPPEDAERFWEALDRDIERLGKPVHVLVTIFWHTRSAAAMVERYSARVWSPTTSRAAVARRAGVVTDAFKPGDPLPGDIEAFRTARTTEVVYWIPAHRSLVPGDVLLGDEAGGVRMCPESWLPGQTIVLQIVRLAGSIGLAVAVLAAAAWALRIREFNEGMSLVARRFKRTTR